MGIYRGRDEIVRVDGVIRALHPTFRYTTIAAADVLHDKAGPTSSSQGTETSPRSISSLTVRPIRQIRRSYSDPQNLEQVVALRSSVERHMKDQALEHIWHRDP